MSSWAVVERRPLCFSARFMEEPLKRFDVVVVGAGYVGLVTGATLSHLGHRVTCVDRDEERISALESGRLPFYEPNLEELVSQGINAERLSFVDPAGLAGLLGETAVLFIAVDTPQNGDCSGHRPITLGGPPQEKPAFGGQQEHGACGERRLRLYAYPGGPRGGRGR